LANGYVSFFSAVLVLATGTAFFKRACKARWPRT